jgi:hypothetical protein
MPTVISSSKVRSWLGVASAIGMGIIAGTFIAGFGTGCRSSRPEPSRSNGPGRDAEAASGRPVVAQRAIDAGAERAADTAAARAVPAPGAADAALDGASDAPRKLVPIRRQRTRRVDRDHVQQGQPLPRDYVE